MKKLFALLLVAGMVAVIACGPSAEEKRAKEVADSTAKADSLAQVQAANQAKMDSIAKIAADSVVQQACTTAITDGETTFIAVIEDVISGTALPAVQKLDSYKQAKLNVAKRKK